jgi:hypothetical protein
MVVFCILVSVFNSNEVIFYIVVESFEIAKVLLELVHWNICSRVLGHSSMGVYLSSDSDIIRGYVDNQSLL